uniref:Ribosomal protein subunit L10 n=1 Tax=Pelargonium citronellum TaxID=73188 RepID=A0A1J0PJW2_9ROSI|nr:ribosomal protein subunit L10 [Pelargonium citronellum]
MPVQRSLIQRARFLRENRSRVPSNFLALQYSGFTSRQLRQLKNVCFMGKTPFSATFFGKQSKFLSSLVAGVGLTRQLYWDEEKQLGSWEFLPLSATYQDPLSLYGKDRGNLITHLDVERASVLDDQEASLFAFYLPSSCLSFVCSGK